MKIEVFQFQLARLDLAAFQHIVDERKLRFSALLNGIRERPLLFGQRCLQQQTRHPDHAVHRRAQFVRDHR
jgi:hypothetical protein